MTTSTATMQPTTDYGVLVATLREVLADRKAIAPALAGRLDRAAALLITRDVRPASLGGWLIESERHAGEYYRVTTGTDWACPCVDFQRHAGMQDCKHILAVRLLLSAHAYEAGPEPSAPLPFPATAFDLDAPIPFELTAKALTLLDGTAA